MLNPRFTAALCLGFLLILADAAAAAASQPASTGSDTIIRISPYASLPPNLAVAAISQRGWSHRDLRAN